jgi:xanthine dehydrogenase YagS FAD-binding subunit
MRPFDYASPTTADQVPALLGKTWGEVEILAGGSDLLSLMKDEITTPKRLVNIKTVEGLHAISTDHGTLHLGALATLDRISAASLAQRNFPMLAASASARAAGTSAQGTACWGKKTGSHSCSRATIATTPFSAMTAQHFS